MAGSFDSTLIDQIVGEVLAQLRQRVESAGSTKENGRPAAQPRPQEVKGIELTAAVITAETLKNTAKLDGTIHISPKAIITPSARDYLREYRIQLVRNNRHTNGDQNPARQQGVIVASHLPDMVRTFLDEARKKFSTDWKVEVESESTQVIERTRSIICRGESPQVLVFVKQPHRVSCAVNRNSQCRAAVVRREADVQVVRSEMGANVICVDLEQPSYMELRRIFRTITETHRQVLEPGEV